MACLPLFLVVGGNDGSCFVVEVASSLVLVFLLFSPSGVVMVVFSLLVVAASFLFLPVAPTEFMAAVAFFLFEVVASSVFGVGGVSAL